MKHIITVRVPVEKRGLLVFKKPIIETRTIEVDGKSYGKIKDQQKKNPYTVEEMIFYDWILED